MQPVEPIHKSVLVETIPPGGETVKIDASPAELAALAKFLDVPAVRSLAATLEVKPVAGGEIAVTGTLNAVVTRTCVVTLDNFDETVAEEVDARFAPETIIEARERARIAGEDDEGEEVHKADLDLPDPILDGRIDLGALTVEFLSLSLDPYPRKPGAAFETEAAGEETAANRPFAALSELMERSKGQKG